MQNVENKENGAVLQIIQPADQVEGETLAAEEFAERKQLASEIKGLKDLSNTQKEKEDLLRANETLFLEKEGLENKKNQLETVAQRRLNESIDLKKQMDELEAKLEQANAALVLAKEDLQETKEKQAAVESAIREHAKREAEEKARKEWTNKVSELTMQLGKAKLNVEKALGELDKINPAEAANCRDEIEKSIEDLIKTYDLFQVGNYTVLGVGCYHDITPNIIIELKERKEEILAFLKARDIEEAAARPRQSRNHTSVSATVLPEKVRAK